MENLKRIVERRGTRAITLTKKAIANIVCGNDPVSSALKYFSNVTLMGGLPVFPALISLSCEAVGEKPEKTAQTAAALTLLAAAADIHDDIIDQSENKYGKKTVFGKFGKDAAILAGDALLFKGFSLFNLEIELLSRTQRTEVQRLLQTAFHEIVFAEAKETILKKLTETTQDSLKIIEAKAAIPELYCKIGAIIGNGGNEEVKSLGNYGRMFGILSVIRDEFADLIEYDELRDRIGNGTLPLPVLYALQDSEISGKVKAFVKDANITEESAENFADMIMMSEKVKQLQDWMRNNIKDTLDAVAFVKEKSVVVELKILLDANLQDLWGS